MLEKYLCRFNFLSKKYGILLSKQNLIDGA